MCRLNWSLGIGKVPSTIIYRLDAKTQFRNMSSLSDTCMKQGHATKQRHTARLDSSDVLMRHFALQHFREVDCEEGSGPSCWFALNKTGMKEDQDGRGRGALRAFGLPG